MSIRSLEYFLVGSFLILVLGIGLYLLTGGFYEGGLPFLTYRTCMVNELTGWYCPTCGGTRAIEALFKGQVIAALSYNWLVIFALIFVSYYWGKSAHLILKGKSLTDLYIRPWIIWGWLFLVFAFTLFRNI